MHERAPRAAAVANDESDCVLTVLFTQLAKPEESLLAEACVIHADESAVSSSERLDALVAPTSVGQVGCIVLTYLGRVTGAHVAAHSQPRHCHRPHLEPQLLRLPVLPLQHVDHFYAQRLRPTHRPRMGGLRMS